MSSDVELIFDEEEDVEVEVDPKTKHYYHHQLGCEYLILDRYSEANDEFTEALKFIPNDVDTLFNRSVALFSLKIYTRAIDDLNTVIISLNHKHSKCYNLRGLILEKMGKCNLALPDFTRAVRQSPRTREYLINRAMLYLRVGDFSSCHQDLDVCTKFDKKYPKVHLARARAFLTQDKAELAYSAMKRCMDCDSQTFREITPVTHMYFGLCKLQTKRLLPALNTFYRLKPDNKIVFYMRGLCHFFSQKFDRALFYLDLYEEFNDRKEKFISNEEREFENLVYRFYGTSVKHLKHKCRKEKIASKRQREKNERLYQSHISKKVKDLEQNVEDLEDSLRRRDAFIDMFYFEEKLYYMGGGERVLVDPKVDVLEFVGRKRKKPKNEVFEVHKKMRPMRPRTHGFVYTEEFTKISKKSQELVDRRNAESQKKEEREEMKKKVKALKKVLMEKKKKTTREWLTELIAPIVKLKTSVF